MGTTENATKTKKFKCWGFVVAYVGFVLAGTRVGPSSLALLVVAGALVLAAWYLHWNLRRYNVWKHRTCRWTACGLGGFGIVIAILSYFQSVLPNWIPPSVPSIEISSLNGLRQPLKPGVAMTAELYHEYKEARLTIVNSNKVDLYDFTARVHLPFPFVVSAPPVFQRFEPAAPAGVTVDWRYARLPAVSKVTGPGEIEVAEVHEAYDWDLSIDRIPPGRRVEIPLLSQKTRFPTAFGVSPPPRIYFEDPAPPKLRWFLLGTYLVDSNGTRVPQQVLVPIKRESATNLTFSSYPPESSTNRWVLSPNIMLTTSMTKVSVGTPKSHSSNTVPVPSSPAR